MQIPPGPVEIKLNTQVRFTGEHPCPACQHVLAVQRGVVAGGFLIPAVEIALKRQGVSVRRKPVRSKTALSHVPCVRSVVSIRQLRAVTIEMLRINPEEQVRTDVVTVSHTAKT